MDGTYLTVRSRSTKTTSAFREIELLCGLRGWGLARSWFGRGLFLLSEEELVTGHGAMGQGGSNFAENGTAGESDQR